MWIDPVVEKVRSNREELVKEFNYDLKKISKYLKENQGKSGHKVISKDELDKKRLKEKVS